MPQDFDFKLAGQSVPVSAASLIMTMDTAADGFSGVDVVINRDTEPELYELIKAPRYTPVVINLDGELSFTGNLTKRRRTSTKSGRTTILGGLSRTFNFIQSHIPANVGNSYEMVGLTLHGIAELLAKSTQTKVVFETEPGGVFNRITSARGLSAFEFLRPLAQKRSQIMSSTVKGELLFHTANIDGETVGTLEEGKSLLAKEFSVDFDDSKRFKTYKIISMTPFGRAQAVVSDDNINQPRHKVIEADGIAGSVEEIAAWQRNLSIVEALTIPVPVVGWTAPNGKRWEPNTLVTYKSETAFVENGFTFLIRSVEFIFNKSTKTAIVNIIPPNVYTKNAVVEPWFE